MSDTRILINFTEYTRLVRADEIMSLLLHLSGEDDAWKVPYILQAVREMHGDKINGEGLLDVIKKFEEEIPCSIGSF